MENFQVQKTTKIAKKGPNFAKIKKKKLGHSLTFTPERLYTKFQKIGLSDLEKMRYKQTDGLD